MKSLKMSNIFQKSVNRFLLRAEVLLSGVGTVGLHINSIYSSKNILNPWNTGINVRVTYSLDNWKLTTVSCICNLIRVYIVWVLQHCLSHKAQPSLFLDVVQMGTTKEGCTGDIPVFPTYNIF